MVGAITAIISMWLIVLFLLLATSCLAFTINKTPMSSRRQHLSVPNKKPGWNHNIPAVVVDTTHPSMILRPAASSSPDDDDEDDESTRRSNRVDRLKEWLTKETNMVRPIRMEDGSFADETPPPPRVKASMDKFGGSNMPQLGDILGSSDKASQESSKSRRNVDYSWFDPMRKEIEDKYLQVRNEIMQQVEDLRKEDPEGVPSNAESIMESVWRQEMEDEIATVRERTAMEIIAEYEAEERQFAENRDITGLRDEKVDRLLEETKKDDDRRAAFQAEIDRYRDYERQASQRAADLRADQQPRSGEDLDAWALKRLEDMLSSRQDSTAVLDILEENIEELQSRIEKEKRREGKIRPETAKEWQMYRSIATRIARDELEAAGEESANVIEAFEEDEDAIAIQLQSWKRFQEKEASLRKASGLARGPRLPFEWQEADRDARIEAERMGSAPREDKSRAEIRREVNQKALEAMEDLVTRSQGTRQGDRLAQELEALRSMLASDTFEDELEEGDTVVPEIRGPVDISDIFSSSVDDKPLPRSESTRYEPPRISVPPTVTGSAGAAYSPPMPPNTPFFSENVEDRASTIGQSKAPRPDTPFFSSDNEEVEQEQLDTSKLGTIDEQKLRRMYRRAGATTEAEKEKIRRDWEAFQNIEKEKRERSGLSATEGVEGLDSSSLGYDVSDVLTGDGDIDAEKVLSKIGPRPKRSKKSGLPTTSAAASDVDDKEVLDDVFRAVSAVGGGRTKDDPEAKARAKAAFEGFVRKEEQVREILDEVEAGMTNGTLTPIVEPDSDEEGVEYAESVLQSMSPRTPRERKRKRLDDYERAMSDGEIPLEEDDDEIAERALEEDEADLVPGWLRKEQGAAPERSKASSSDSFLGSDVSRMLEEEEEYEKNMRQLAEYERRRASKRPRQMGIDITEVLGRDSDDYKDYKYDEYYRTGSMPVGDTSTFAWRKANLLQYEELNVVELNSLMAYKDSVYITGVSQYTPRIKKPFKEFGAIFRLEGVLLDITGFHYQAWKEVAERFKFNPPTMDDAKRAAVTRSEIAVRRIFCWTDDFMLTREVVRAHREALEQIFNKWMNEHKLTYDPSAVSVPEESTNLDEGSQLRAPVVLGTSRASVDQQLDAWAKTAKHFGYEEPTLDQAVFASVISPDDAVTQAFRWTSDSDTVSLVVRVFQSFLSDPSSLPSDALEIRASEKTNAAMGIPQQSSVLTSNRGGGGPRGFLSENDMLEIQYQVWSTIAKEQGFEPPTPDEALGAMVINDPALIIRDGFAWTDDKELISRLTENYLSSVRKMVAERTGGLPPEQAARPAAEASQSPASSTGSPGPASTPSGPTRTDLLEIHGYSWTVAAQEHGLGGVPFDRIHLTVHLRPEEAVTVLFPGVHGEVAKKVTSTFSTELKGIFKKYLEENNLAMDSSSPPEKPLPATEQTQVKAGPTDAEVFQAAFDAWTTVAKNRGFTSPSEEQVQFSMAVGPEDAIPSFGWTSDVFEQKEIVQEYLKQVERSSSAWTSGYRLGAQSSQPKIEPFNDSPPAVKILPGTAKWLKSLLDVEMQCGVVSHLDRKQMDVLLDYTGLSNFFPADKRVSSSCGYNRESQQLLGAALRLERRPDHCVVFDTTPQSAVAAHDVEMKSVSMIGVYPMYELLSADSTARYCDEFTAMNIRRLFGERIYDQPMFESQQERPGPKAMPTRTKTRFWEEGDRS